jgi:N-acyl-D-aspartate/D-glutamate deacylase
LDGGGNPWVNADVAIKDGRFAKIGRVAGRGSREIDARGDYVSPGWIDMMDQSGEVLLKNGLAENKLREGVTSARAARRCLRRKSPITSKSSKPKGSR